MWEANIALELGDRKTMRDRLSAAFTVAQTDGGDFMFFNWGRPWMPRLCHEALSANIESTYVRDLIRRYRLPPPSTSSPYWPWPVRIYLLGQFALYRDDEPVHFGRKAPRRVLSVLKYIVANGGDGIGLGPLADALWPDQDGDAARKALGVALARLRKLLGGFPLVRVIDERVSINQEMLWTDTGAFEKLVAELDSGSGDGTVLPETAARLLTLHRGDLLPSDRDEPWTLRPRLRLRAQFIRCLGSFGIRIEATGQWQLALDCYRRGLEVDDLAEEFYQGLMRCHARLAQPAQGMATFERLRQTLATALGIAPSSVSEGLARSLREQSGVTSVNS